MPRAPVETRLDVPTPRGTAEVVLERRIRRTRGLLVLGHGAGGGIEAVSLLAVRSAALRADFAVARVVQPYRVAGKRLPPAARALDEAWLVAVARCQQWAGPGPLIVGGRSSGARVACRTARTSGAIGVLALAYPLHPPGRPESTRAGELDPTMPTLVINGDRDPFGVPTPDGKITVVVLAGERHELNRDPDAVGAAAAEWLLSLAE